MQRQRTPPREHAGRRISSNDPQRPDGPSSIMQTDELQARLAAIVATSDDAIVSKNLDGVILSWNAAAERIFGYTADEIIGRPILILLPPERVDEEAAILAKIRRGERVDHFETVRVRKDGRRIDISVTISPIHDAAGNVIGASKIARDISEYKQFVKEREELLSAERAARSEAERVGRMKDEFLATLSHELRTPLNAILGWSQLLKYDTTDPAMLEEGLEVIERNARVQTQLIADLLDMSRIISGKLRLDVQQVELASVIGAALDSVRPSAEFKQIRLHKVLDPIAGPVSGDPNRLQQIVWNLLSNAIKFTPKGGRVEVLLERVNSHVEITVSDTGQGIAADFLPHVFDRFRQADSSTTRHQGGLGLGLAIVKQLVELHGGRITAKSRGEGHGSTFSVILPVAITRHAPERREHPSRADGPPTLDFAGISLAGTKILVIDDEADARDLIKRLLAERSATVFVAESADRGLELLQSEKPNLVLSDVGMPDKDGYEFIRAVRKLPPDQGGRTPAVALTAFARSEDRTRAMMAGYQVHLSKPVEAQELIATVASLTGRTGA